MQILTQSNDKQLRLRCFTETRQAFLFTGRDSCIFFIVGHPNLISK